MIVWVYDRWGNQTGTIGDINGLEHTDEIGSLDSIEFDTPSQTISKGDYLLWRDEFGEWHEHIVRSVKLKHDDGMVLASVYAVNSIAELNLSYKGERDSYGFSNSVAWSRLLEDTRWTLGTCENLGTNNIKFYHETVYEGIVDIVSKWGGEIYTSLTVGASGVTARRVNHVKARGSDDGLLFTYGFDMDGVERKVELDDVYTRLHVFGKGEPTYGSDGSQTGNGRRLSFASINGGKDYVEDNDAMQTWGVIGKSGTRQHSEGVYVFAQCEDASELLKLAKDKLNEVKEPRVSYSADVAILADAGMDFKNARAGDTCYIRDRELDERLSGRIMKVQRYLNSERPTKITLGNVRRTLGGEVSANRKAIGRLQNSSAKWDGVAEMNRAWLSDMQDSLNDMMNVNGGYAYWEEGDGITVYDRPKDQNPTMCIQLKGAGFRIANRKKSNGEWDFKTFGTGDGFTADLMNVGTLQCGTNRIDLDSGTVTLDQGTITDKRGRNTWNLSDGTLKTNYMEASNIMATGSMTTGTTYGMRLANGSLTGFYGDTEVIQFDANLKFTNGKYGGRITFPQYLVLRGPDLAVGDSTSSNGTIGKTGKAPVIYSISRSGSGSISWSETYIQFTNGICTSMST